MLREDDIALTTPGFMGLHLHMRQASMPYKWTSHRIVQNARLFSDSLVNGTAALGTVLCATPANW